MRTAFGILSLWMVAAAWIPTAHAADGYPKVYNKYLSHTVEAHQWAELAKWDVLVLDGGFEETNPGGLATLRGLNPDIILIGFVSINGILEEADTLPVGALNWKRWHGINDNDFWLRDTQGNIVSDWPDKWNTNITMNSPVNGEGEQYWEWLAGFIYEEMWLNGPGWDGIFLDDTWEDIAWLNDFLPDPIDSDEDGVADDETLLNQSWRAANEACVDALRSLVGPSAIIVSNGHNTYHQSLNGAQLEVFPTHGSPDQGNPYGYSWNKWMFTTTGSYTMGDNYNSVPQQLMMINAGWLNGTTDDPDTTTGRFQAHKRFTLGSALLKDGYYSLDRTYVHDTIWWQPEYEMYLGAPLGPYFSEVVDGKTVYIRHYESASVAVNPNNDPVTGEFGFPDVGDWDAYIGPPFTYAPPPDTTPPSVVWAYSGFVVDHQSFEVRWQAVGDDGNIGLADHYEIRVSQNTMYTEQGWQAGTVYPQSITPLSAGTLQALRVEGLQPETQYYVCVRAVDDAGNMGDLPTWHPKYTTLPDAGSDTEPPSAINDLALVSVAGANITFSWSAPGDDGTAGVAQSYDARWSRNRINAGNWSSADPIAGLPVPAGDNALQTATLTGVNAEDSLYVAIRAEDDAGNVGELSNVLGIQSDAFPAETVTDLSVSDSTQTSLSLTFTAPDNPGGGVVGYFVRYLEGSEFLEEDWGTANSVPMVAPQTPGQTVTALIDGLTGEKTYAFRLRTMDGELRLSDPSNLAVGSTPGADPPPPPPPPAPRDTVPPNIIDDLSLAELSVGTLHFTFSAPADDSGQVVAYDARYLPGNTFEPESWDAANAIVCGSPKAPGSLEDLELAGLNPGTAYTVRVRSQDEAGNWSDPSPAVTGVTEEEPPPPPVDTTPPAVITDLAVVASTVNSLSFAFSAPADDSGQAAEYEARYVPGQSFDVSAWDDATVIALAAPKPQDQEEDFTLTGLSADSWYTVRIRARDQADNWSALSPAVSGVTQDAPPPPPPPDGDVTGPEAVSDLAVVASTDSSLTLQWTAPADAEGEVVDFDLRYRNSLLFSEGYWFGALHFNDLPAPGAPGDTHTVVVSNLEPDEDYSFRLKSRDDAGNWSDLSNLALGATDTVYVPPPPPPAPDTLGPAAVLDLLVTDASETTLSLSFTAPADTEGEVTLYDLRYREGDALGSEDWDAAVSMVWDAGLPDAPQAVVVEGLAPGVGYALALKSKDDSGNWSGLSNVALGATDTVYVPPPPPPPADVWPPEAVDDLLVASSTETSLVLTFTAPPDSGGQVVGYDLRYVPGESFPESEWDQGVTVRLSGAPTFPRAPGDIGLLESAVVHELEPDSPYAFRIKAVDDSENWSDLSAVTVGRTDTVYVPPPPPPPADTTGPAPVSDLLVDSATETTLALSFTPPLDAEGEVAAYDLRMVSGDAFPAAAWDTAQLIATTVGEPEVQVSGLQPGSTYAFRMKSRDDAGNWSELSNTASGATDSIHVPPPPPPPPAPLDTLPPMRVTDLAASADEDGVVTLTWTAPVDTDGEAGISATAYSLRWADGSLSEASWDGAQVIPTAKPGSPGAAEQIVVALWALPEETSRVLAFAMTAADTAGNVSDLSNVATVELEPPVTPPDTQPPSVVINVGAVMEEEVVVVAWDPVPDVDLDYYRVYRRVEGGAEFALTRDEWQDVSYVDDAVEQGVEYAYRITAVDLAGNESAFSQSASVRVPEDPAPEWPVNLFRAGPPRPNPVEDRLEMTLELGDDASVRVAVLDVQGRRVHAETWFAPRGESVWAWDRRSLQGRVPAGVYWVRILAQGQVRSQKVLLLP